MLDLLLGSLTGQWLWQPTAGARVISSHRVRLGQVRLSYRFEMKIVTFGCETVNWASTYLLLQSLVTNEKRLLVAVTKYWRIFWKTAKIAKKVSKISVMTVTLVPSIYDANITAIVDKSFLTIFGYFLESSVMAVTNWLLYTWLSSYRHWWYFVKYQVWL